MKRLALIITLYVSAFAVALVVGGATHTARAEAPAPVIEIVGPVTGETVEAIQKGLAGVKPGSPVTIHIDSPGGSVFAGLRAIDLIQRAHVRTTCEVGGVALSMAAVILESPACGVRVVHPWSVLMFHRVSTSLDKADAAKVGAALQTLATLDRALALIVSVRVGWTPDAYLHVAGQEFWITGADAVPARFADKEQ